MVTLLSDRSGVNDKVIKCWQKIPITKEYSEQNLELNLVQPLLLNLGLDISQIQADINLGKGAGLTPDRLIYVDINRPPALVIEVKKRVPELANASEEEFIDLCKSHPLYRSAIGYPDKPNNNGIRQYLNNSNPKIEPNRLADYGLVFNGDFFQLWRRVEGLILPLTPIQRVTEKSIPNLIEQLTYCLHSKPKALVTSIWNRKGGVAKTTNTFNIGSVLALKSKKVLLIDLDTQNDLTRAFKLIPEDYSERFELCLDKIQADKLEAAKEILANTIQTRSYKTNEGQNFTLSIFPGEEKTLKKFREHKNLDQKEKMRLIKGLIKLCIEDYDYIFIDISPASDILTLAALASCDVILIPSDYSRKTLHHAVSLHNVSIPNLRKERAKKETLHLGPWNLGLVFSNCPSGVEPKPGDIKKTLLEQCIQQELKNNNFSGKQYQTRLKIYAQTKLAEYKQLPVISWQTSPITKLYHQLADEVFLTHNFIDS